MVLSFGIRRSQAWLAMLCALRASFACGRLSCRRSLSMSFSGSQGPGGDDGKKNDPGISSEMKNEQIMMKKSLIAKLRQTVKHSPPTDPQVFIFKMQNVHCRRINLEEQLFDQSLYCLEYLFHFKIRKFCHFRFVLPCAG